MCNLVILLGNAGKDPMDIPTKTGTSMITFSLATHEMQKVGGELKETTAWHDIVVLGKLADTCKKFVRKGKQMQVVGTIEYREFTNAQGVSVRKTQIRASDITFLGKPATEQASLPENTVEESSSDPFPGGSRIMTSNTMPSSASLIEKTLNS